MTKKKWLFQFSCLSFVKGRNLLCNDQACNSVVKQAVDHVNPNQRPVIALDQTLYAIAKQIEQNWSNIYGKEKFVIMMGAFYIEMAALKSLGMYSYFKGTRY